MSDRKEEFEKAKVRPKNLPDAIFNFLMTGSQYLSYRALGFVTDEEREEYE